MQEPIREQCNRICLPNRILIELQAAQASTALPARYQRLGFEFATASKKINLCNWFLEQKIWESTTFMA
jgi:hypothetical protein